MPKLSFITYFEPKKKKCNCCDRTKMLTQRVLITEESRLVGDLELCETCAQALTEIFNQSQPEIVEKEWKF